MAFQTLPYSLVVDHAILPRTRAEAQVQGYRFYFSGDACLRGHVAERYTSSRNCAACTREKANQLYREDREANRLRAAQWREANHARAVSNAASWCNRNREKRRQIARDSARRLRPKNKAYAVFQHALRQKRMRNATPPWVNKKEILAFYRAAQRLQTETGLAHHVDHIMPIAGKGFCGLNVPWNLQVIPASQNQQKYNKVPSGIEILERACASELLAVAGMVHISD